MFRSSLCRVKEHSPPAYVIRSGYKRAPSRQSWHSKNFEWAEQREEQNRSRATGFLTNLLKGFPHLKVTSPLSRVCLDLLASFLGFYLVGPWCFPFSTRSAILPPAAAPLPRPGTIWDTTRHQRDLTPAWDHLSLRYVQLNITKCRRYVCRTWKCEAHF